MKRLLLWLSMLSICGLTGVLVRSQSEGTPTAEMIAAGQKFLGILQKDQRSQATIAFTDEERLNWHYIPRERRGVPFKVLTPAQRDAADLLLQSSLKRGWLAERPGAPEA
jgi:Protein of unknown function (DUF3500)